MYDHFQPELTLGFSNHNKMCYAPKIWLAFCSKMNSCFAGVLTKAIYKTTEEDKKEEEVKKTLEQHDNIVTHYKSVIRVQVKYTFG